MKSWRWGRVLVDQVKRFNLCLIVSKEAWKNVKQDGVIIRSASEK